VCAGSIVSDFLDFSIPVVKNGTDNYTVTLTNSTQSTGGSNAETVEHAKKYAPYFFRSQNRAVTGEDYNALANSFVGTAGLTAKAVPVLRDNAASNNMIDIYVLAKATDLQVERATLAFKAELLEYLNTYKMFSDHLTIVDGLVRTVDLVCTIFVNRSQEPNVENIKSKVADKLIEFFNVTNMDFGESLSISELSNSVLSLSDIRYFKVDNINNDVFVNFNELIQLNNFEINVELV